MRAKTKLEKEAASKMFAALTEKQEGYVIKNFFHYAYRTGKDNCTCMRCGGTFRSDNKKAVCPQCGSRVDMIDTQKRHYDEGCYFMVAEAKEPFQVLRYFFVIASSKKGEKADFSVREAGRIFICEDGRTLSFARRRSMSYYIDAWEFSSDIELRKGYNPLMQFSPYLVYPKYGWAKFLRNRHFRASYISFAPVEFIVKFLQDKGFEKLAKIGTKDEIKSYRGVLKYWKSYLIAKRKGIENITLWYDMVAALDELGKDLRNPYYVSPDNLREAHDRWILKMEAKRRKERQQQQQMELTESNILYLEDKKNYIGFSFSCNGIDFHVLQSVYEFMEEGDAMHHCVFSNKYYERKNSLIFSATIEGKRIETIQYSLDTETVLQSFGACNQLTPYHDLILQSFELNRDLIRRAG